MARYIWHTILYSCLLLVMTESRAQVNAVIRGDFMNMPFKEFIHRLELQCDCTFFFDPQSMDSLVVNLQSDSEELGIVLNKVLKPWGFYFAINRSKQIFITRGTPIQTELAIDYFKPVDKLLDSSGDKQLSGIGKSKKLASDGMANKLLVIGEPGKDTRASINGTIRDLKTGEVIVSATIVVNDGRLMTQSDQYGSFSLTLPTGRYSLKVTSVGMKEVQRQVQLNGSGTLNIEMEEYVASLKSVLVVAEKNSNVKGLQMGVNRLNIRTIKQVPVVMGEADVLRVVLTLPGVVSVGEATAGFNVRGGSADQNLILLNDATIYNPTHLFGFFSSFNPDMVKGVELYKSSIPEKYGSRVSSVLDVTTKDGNRKKFSGNGGIGPLTSRLTLEGPLVKDKASFLLGGRTTYSDWILRSIPNSAYDNSTASFSDLNLHVSHNINEHNTLYLTGYFSKDNFRLNSDTLYQYSNKNLIMKWRHKFGNKVNGAISAGIDQYQYQVSSSNNKVNAFNLGFDIRQLNFRSDFTYTPNAKHQLNFGLNAIHFRLHPGYYEPVGDQSIVETKNVEAEQGLETAVYLGDKWAISPKLSLSAGARISMFNYLGPQTEYGYASGVPREEGSMIDTIDHASGKIIKTYFGPEWRIALRYSVSNTASFKFSYNSIRQYIHMLTNTAVIAPTDIWKLSDPYIKPQIGDQLSVGYYKNLKGNLVETSIEVYYKRLRNYPDYKSGAQLLLNEHIETDIINTRRKSYGVELMVKKPEGRINGWINYTYSRALLQQDDPIAGETINRGDYYPANYDIPHSANFIGNYRFSHRFSISLNLVYHTGRPITLPIAVFDQGGGPRVYYSDRNQFRIPDYFRADFSFIMEGNHKVKQRIHNSWTLGVYNFTARRNIFSVYFTQDQGQIKGYQLSIFGTAIPFVTYNFRF